MTISKVTLYGPRPYGGTITTRVDDPLVMDLLDRGYSVSRLWAVAEPRGRDPEPEPEPDPSRRRVDPAPEPDREPIHRGPAGDPPSGWHPSVPGPMPDLDEIGLDRIVSIVDANR